MTLIDLDETKPYQNVTPLSWGKVTLLYCTNIYMKSISWLWFQWMYKKRKERKFIERAKEIKADLEQLNPSTK